MWHFSNNVPVGIKCCMYAFVVLASVWLTTGTYYYFTEEVAKSMAAFISSGVALTLFLLFALLECYLKWRASKNTMINRVVEESYPVIKSAMDKLPDVSTMKGLASIVPTAIFLLSLYLQNKCKK